MMLGRDVLQPLDIFLGTTDIGEEEDLNTYVSDTKSNLESIHREARENLRTSQHRQKKYYDLRSNQNTYGIGGIAYKTNSATLIGTSPKLKSPWKGPYIITEIKSPVLYRIKDRKKEEVVHHDRIKSCHNKNNPLWFSRLRNEVLRYCDLENNVADNSESEVEGYNLD